MEKNEDFLLALLFVWSMWNKDTLGDLFLDVLEGVKGSISAMEFSYLKRFILSRKMFKNPDYPNMDPYYLAHWIYLYSFSNIFP